MHAEVLGAREDGLGGRHLVLELAAARLGVRGFLDLAAVGEGDAALDRERAALGGRPGHDRGAGPQMDPGGDAERLAQQHREPRNAAL